MNLWKAKFSLYLSNWGLVTDLMWYLIRDRFLTAGNRNTVVGFNDLLLTEYTDILWINLDVHGITTFHITERKVNMTTDS